MKGLPSTRRTRLMVVGNGVDVAHTSKMNAVGTSADHESRTQVDVRSKGLLSQSPFATTAMAGDARVVVGVVAVVVEDRACQ